jgi:hypothetical protein
MQPVGFLSPILDGRITHFYEWQEAGFFPSQSYRGSMYREEALLSGFYFGFDLRHLYFRLDPIPGETDVVPGLQFHIHFSRPQECEMIFPLRFPKREEPSFILRKPAEESTPFTDRFFTIASDRIIELSISFAALQFHPRQRVDFFLQVQKDDLELERYPRNGYLSFVVPDVDFESNLWQV